MTLDTSRETQAWPAVFRSLGLKAIIDQMRDDRSYSILDLGPALEVNVKFWSRFSCRLEILDFHRGLREWKTAAQPEERKAEAAFAALLPSLGTAAYDLILAWDLFNYFDLRALEALVRRLGLGCRPGTKLFALVSDLPAIPASPMTFKIIGRGELGCEIRDAETRPSPRHQPRDIARLMTGFTDCCSFLLRHGLREYVFAYK